jgi:bifunctional DNase/RNase
MLREMTVSGLTIDPFTNSPIMILKDVDSDKAVPIWIGLLEATAIASELENIKFSRPMTHDLLKNIMELMETTVTKVEVCDLRDNTYFALIYIIREGREVSIDARPSDAIALALRTKAPIFVADVVIQKARRVDLSAKEAITTEDAKKWTEVLEGLDRMISASTDAKPVWFLVLVEKRCHKPPLSLSSGSPGGPIQITSGNLREMVLFAVLYLYFFPKNQNRKPKQVL